MNQKISIAIATCNGEQFIAEQLSSIVNQSLPPNEIIICDDSRNKLTFNAIALFQTTHPNLIEYYYNDKQLGVSKNFEKAISLTTGDIIILSDQDDVWGQDKVAKLVSSMNKSQKCDGTFCNSELVDEDLNPLGITHWALRGFNNCPNLDFFLKRVPVAGHNMAFKAKLKEILLPFPDLSECHDTWIGLIITVTSGWSIINETLTKFRQHNNNTSKVGRYSKLKEAIESIKNSSFSWHVELYNELIKRLSESDYKIQTHIMDLLVQRRDHSLARSKMDCNIIKRLPLILKEVINRRYFKFARGWKSIVQDTFLRGL